MERTAPSCARLVPHAAPGAAAWLYLAWILAAHSLRSEGQWHLLRCLWLVQVGVVLSSVLGGVAALRLPSRLQMPRQ